MSAISDLISKSNPTILEIAITQLWASDLQFQKLANKAAAQLSALEEAAGAVRPIAESFNLQGGCVPLNIDKQEEILHSIFNDISLQTIADIAAALATLDALK